MLVTMMNVNDVTANFNSAQYKAPLRGALVVGAASHAALADRLRAVQKDAEAGRTPAPSAPAEKDLRALERVAIDYVDSRDLAQQVRFRIESVGSQSTDDVESAALARHLPWSWSGPESGVPVYRSRFAVREHAETVASNGANRGGNVCRSRSRDDAICSESR